MNCSWSLTSVVFFSQIRPGADQGWGKIGHGGPLLQESSSSDQKDIATNQMHSDDLQACGMKCCYFLFHSGVKFLTRFNVFLTKTSCLILMQFLEIFMRLSVQSTFILCNFHVCKWKNAYIKKLRGHVSKHRALCSILVESAKIEIVIDTLWKCYIPIVVEKNVYCWWFSFLFP